MGDESSNLVPQGKAPRRSDFFLVFCRLLNVITVISASLCLVAHGMAFVVGPPVFQVMFMFSCCCVLTDWPDFDSHTGSISEVVWIVILCIDCGGGNWLETFYETCPVVRHLGCSWCLPSQTIKDCTASVFYSLGISGSADTVSGRIRWRRWLPQISAALS